MSTKSCANADQGVVNSLWTSDDIRRYKSGSTLTQVILAAPSHSLNQCWLFISEVLWYSPEGNFTGDAKDNYLWYQYKNYQFDLRLQQHLPCPVSKLFAYIDGDSLCIAYLARKTVIKCSLNAHRPFCCGLIYVGITRSITYIWAALGRVYYKEIDRSSAVMDVSRFLIRDAGI